QVQERKQAELEDREQLLVHVLPTLPAPRHPVRRAPSSGHDASKVTTVLPSVISSPSPSSCELTRMPLTRVPLVEPRSTRTHPLPWGRTSAWLRLTLGSASCTVDSGRRPKVTVFSPRASRSPVG